MTIEPGPASAPSDNGKNMALVLYILSLAGFFTGGLTSLVALIIGLVKKDEFRDTIYASHFEFVNMTNIWGLVGFIVGFILLFLVIGLLVLPLVSIWYLVRLVVGLLKLMENKPIDNPKTLLI